MSAGEQLLRVASASSSAHGSVAPAIVALAAHKHLLE
jgi:hypothetical protein